MRTRNRVLSENTFSRTLNRTVPHSRLSVAFGEEGTIPWNGNSTGGILTSSKATQGLLDLQCLRRRLKRRECKRGRGVVLVTSVAGSYAVEPWVGGGTIADSIRLSFVRMQPRDSPLFQPSLFPDRGKLGTVTSRQMALRAILILHHELSLPHPRPDSPVPPDGVFDAVAPLMHCHRAATARHDIVLVEGHVVAAHATSLGGAQRTVGVMDRCAGIHQIHPEADTSAATPIKVPGMVLE